MSRIVLLWHRGSIDLTAVGLFGMGRVYGGLGWVVKSGPEFVSELRVHNRAVTCVIQIASWVPPFSIFIFWLNGVFGTVGISKFFSIFLCKLYSYLNCLHRESQFHIVLSRFKFKVLLLTVWFQIVLCVWTNRRSENRVMTNVSVKERANLFYL